MDTKPTKEENAPAPVAPTPAAPVEEQPFELKPVTDKPKRQYKKGSKYDPVLDAFMKSKQKLVEVEIPEKDANYIRTQLSKRIEARNLKKVTVSVVNNKCYLEK